MRFQTAAMVIGMSAATAVAAGDSALISARQQAMKDMAAAAKTIDSQFKGETPYDQRTFKKAAETIRDHSGRALVALFPADTLGAPSDARLEIAANPQEFAALANHLQQFAQALAAAADKAPSEITPAMRMGADTGGGGAVSLLGRRARTDKDPGSLPAEHVFHLMLQDCTGCHALYRERR